MEIDPIHFAFDVGAEFGQPSFEDFLSFGLWQDHQKVPRFRKSRKLDPPQQPALSIQRGAADLAACADEVARRAAGSEVFQAGGRDRQGFGKTAAARFFSMIRTLRPRRASSSAAVSPVGPAPTTRTSGRRSAESSIHRRVANHSIGVSLTLCTSNTALAAFSMGLIAN